MTYLPGLHPGATWRRTDLQIHTPRDPQWSGSPHLPGGDEASEAAREAWADEFVQACLARGLTAIAITDHHDFCFVPYVRRAIARSPEAAAKIWLYPGAEVTCRDAVQCLVLFDSEAAEPLWDRLFGGHLQNVDKPDGGAAKNPQATECGRDVEAFLRGVFDDAGLRRRTIVLPHASNENAHKSMIRNGFAPRFKVLPFDGVYTDKAYAALDETTRKKIHGQISQWGRRRRGIIATGDNREASFAKLGAHECWMRLGEPTAEALRQAVLADEARIAYASPELPAHRLLELRVNSQLTGQDFRLVLNDGFNALIGGRGSGKSALLEYLRYALGRSAFDVQDEADETRDREKALLSQTLDGGSVTLVLERDGVIENWTRSGDLKDVVTVEVDGVAEALTIDEAQQRFRARAFYQGQLSSLVLDRSKAAEQITGIAAAEFLDQRRLAERELAAARRTLQSALQRVVEYWVAEAELKRSAASVADLRRRIEAVRAKLEASGLSAAHQALLNDAPRFELASSLIAESQAALASDIELLETRGIEFSVFDGSLQNPEVSEFPEIAALAAATTKANDKVAGALATMTNALRELEREQEKSAEAFSKRHAAFDVEHAEAVAQQASNRALLDEITRLNQELQAALASERKCGTRFDAYKDAPKSLTTAREALATRAKELRDVLESAAEEVQGMSGSSLRAKVIRSTVPKAHTTALTQLCEGCRIRELSSRVEERLRDIFGDAEKDTWHTVVDTLLDAYKYRLQSGAQSIEPDDPIADRLQEALFKPLTSNQLRFVFAALDDASVGRFLLATPEDFIAFEYKDGRSYIPFERASPGQQASALLRLLLTQEAGTLIIDQPEDDLDNKVIIEIAAQLQTTKRKRQLIFATHNPNIVVNGDADKIVALRSSGGDTQCGARVGLEADGAIETENVRSAITDTMEGGQAAFELRSRKYSFEA